MENKKWFLSKTLWVNAIGIVAIIAQSVTGHEVMNLELQASILAGINMILRFLTKQPVAW